MVLYYHSTVYFEMFNAKAVGRNEVYIYIITDDQDLLYYDLLLVKYTYIRLYLK
jgi:hypothetical protein